VLAASAIWLISRGSTKRTVTAYFSAAVGLYPNSDVRVLGVAVGTVEAVEPQGEQVRVTMSVDGDVPIPAGASALVVTPSLVSDRYVQLTPVYTDGPQLPDGAVIPLTRTMVPVELDQLFASLDKLTTALGPDGANADGALNELLHSGATTFDGNGAKVGELIRELGKATQTLSGSQDNLFATVDNIQKFTTMLATSDDQVRRFDAQLAEISQFFAGERDDFAAALHELASALGTVQRFVQDNRSRIQSNVDKLAGTTQILTNQRDSLAEALDRAPAALASLVGAYNPATRSLDSRANLLELLLPGGQ
jgi:virulence factor Mce-like protein